MIEVPDEAKPWVSEAARSSGLGADFIAALMEQESGFRPDAYADDSNGGTWGLLQMNRSVWRGVHPDGADQTPPEGITDPMVHAHYGGMYLKNRLEGVKQLKAAHPDMPFAKLDDLTALVIAHNAGEGNLMKYPDIPSSPNGTSTTSDRRSTWEAAVRPRQDEPSASSRRRWPCSPAR